MKKRVAKVLLWTLAVLVALVLVAFANIGRLVWWSMKPSGAFDANAAPPAPNYNDAANWSALPSRRDVADDVPSSMTGVDQSSAPVDVFYVHPTSYLEGRWNAPVPSKSLDDATDRVATRIQATVFNGCCAVYAPRYRQTNGRNFVEPTADGERAFELAYSDVERAFDAFNARRGETRPFIIAAHSQGTMIAERLLARRVSRTPMRDRLVAAYLIGGRVTVDGLRERSPDIAVCASATQLRCVVAYNARSTSYVPGRFEVRVVDRGQRVCVNPLTWRDDGAAAPASANVGAVFIESADARPRAGFADAQCADGTLRVRSIAAAPRDFMSSLLDRVLGPGNFHPIEYQMYFANLRANAIARSNAMLAERAQTVNSAPSQTHERK